MPLFATVRSFRLRSISFYLINHAQRQVLFVNIPAAMEWPVLGRSRAQPGKRSLPTETEDAEPGPSNKRRQTQPRRHWNMKLATVFRGKGVPEELQKTIEDFAIPEQFKRFLSKYGPQRAQYDGRGFVSDWHPRILSTTRDRYKWTAFSTTRLNVYRLWPETMNKQTAKPLEGRTVLVKYRNKQGNTTRMDPKRVVFAADGYMSVDCGPGTTGTSFTLSYRGVESIELFVDVPR